MLQCTIDGGRTKVTNEISIAFVHQHDATLKRRFPAKQPNSKLVFCALVSPSLCSKINCLSSKTLPKRERISVGKSATFFCYLGQEPLKKPLQLAYLSLTKGNATTGNHSSFRSCHFRSTTALHLVTFAAVIRVVTLVPTNGCSPELCIPFPLLLRTNNMHVTVSSCTNHISRYICRQRSRFPRNGRLLLIGQFKERNAELELAALSGEEHCVTTLITAAKETTFAVLPDNVF